MIVQILLLRNGKLHGLDFIRNHYLRVPTTSFKLYSFLSCMFRNTIYLHTECGFLSQESMHLDTRV